MKKTVRTMEVTLERNTRLAVDRNRSDESAKDQEEVPTEANVPTETQIDRRLVDKNERGRKVEQDYEQS